MVYDSQTTNILKGFDLLNKTLRDDCKTQDVTIIFISDGADDKADTIQKRLEDLMKLQP